MALLANSFGWFSSKLLLVNMPKREIVVSLGARGEFFLGGRSRWEGDCASAATPLRRHKKGEDNSVELHRKSWRSQYPMREKRGQKRKGGRFDGRSRTQK